MLRLRWYRNLSHCVVRSLGNRVRVCLNSQRSVNSRQFPRPIFSESSTNIGPSYVRRKAFPLFVAVTSISTSIAYYIYYRRNIKEYETVDLQHKEDDLYVEDLKYVDEHLDDKIELLQRYGPIPYLIVGGGAATYAAYRAIRAHDPTSKILVLGEEGHYPYMRPPLTKEMWFDNNDNVLENLSFKQWSGKERSIFFDNQHFYFTLEDMLESKNGGVSVLRGTKVVKVDPSAQIVYLDNGKSISYQKCLLATGGKPKNLPVFENASNDVKKHIMVFKNIGDFQRLYKVTEKEKSIVIVGGGFLGSELACALGKRKNGANSKIIELFPESGNLGKVLPQYLSQWTSEQISDQGVQILPNVEVKDITKVGTKVELHLDNGNTIAADYVVVAVGTEPRTEIAEVSGLEIDPDRGGFLVNAELEARKNLWAAGDAASFYDGTLGRRRVDHHDNAIVSGRLAGQNMTGHKKPYTRQAMVWTDLGPELGFEAIGNIDSSLETVGVFYEAPEPTGHLEADDPTKLVSSQKENELPNIQTEKKGESVSQTKPNYDKGVVFYLQDKKIVGIVLCNVFTKMSLARKIIDTSASYDDLAEVAKLFSLHSE